jgi:TRAP transporter 4TM/12TM fusion protein
MIDLAFMGGALFASWHMLYDLQSFARRVGFANQTDIVAGAILIIVLLEASRRVIGITITVIGLVSIVYAMAGARGTLPWLGEFLPGILEHRGYRIDRIVSTLYMGLEGIFGIPLGVAATVVFIFVLFGAFLESTGAGKFFIDLAYAAAGRQRGGPAKAAVVASGLMGSISGSAIANVVTSGAFTIPLMKKLGYKPEEAGGVEAAASTGGQIMPPIMGAGAFLIAEYTQLPYLDIVKLSILPAILYFATVYLFVDIIAAKRGMRGMTEAELPNLKEVFRDGWYYLAPLGILVFFLLRNISPGRVGFVAIVSILAVSLLRFLLRRYAFGVKKAQANSLPELARSGFVNIVSALEAGARNSISVTVACALSGIVVGMIGLTGLGLKFSGLMISFSGGNLLIALLLLILASLVLGMGLPVTASYIVLAVLAAPALQNEFGIPLLIAHLVIFWYSQDSNVTPPVALAAFAAAGIAGANPMKTGIEAWKFAKGLYLIPLFMIYNPEMITGGPWYLVLWTVITAIAALGAFTAALEAYMFTHMYWFSRIFSVIGMVGIFWPNHWYEIAGFCLILLVLGINFGKMRREKAALVGARA